MAKTLIFHPEPELLLTSNKYGAILKTKDAMMEEQEIWIPFDRLDKVIAFLHDIHSKHQRKEFGE